MENFEHTIKRFDEELDKLRHRLTKMATLVKNQVELSVQALLNNDQIIAQKIIQEYAEIDKIDVKIEKQCVRLFALHQPVAIDLRLIISAVSMNDKLEFIGDLAENIAKNILRLKIPTMSISKTLFAELGKKVIDDYNSVLDGFINRNVDLAYSVLDNYAITKQLCKDNFDKLLEISDANPEMLESYFRLVEINRNLKLIGIEIKSIAHEIIFLVEAKFIKHDSQLVRRDTD